MEPLLGRTIAHYRIERELGRGGMATVYLADDLKHGRQVAVKVMHPEMTAAIGQDRFLREIEIAARLSHPHVLPLFDSGAADGQLYYVMPYIAGESLRARLEREKQLPLEDAIRLAREVASALGHAHAQGLIHRDVKPENILLADDIALVADFGIARVRSGPGGATPAATQAGTGGGMLLGTPLYMAPEQAAGGMDLDGRADQYALGCVLYEMLAGHPPFTAPSVTAILARHAHDPVPPLRTVRLGVPDAVERVVEKALAKSPADRYASLARFSEALAMAVSGGRTPTPLPEAQERGIPNNLPKQRTSFVGREKELAECARLLGETRLLTLTGVGGCGKTRLGLRLAESVQDSYPDGVWLVDFAAVTDPTHVPETTAKALGVHDESGRPVHDLLARQLAGKRTLIVLDNCEHLLSSCAELADTLLGMSADLRIIATSRESLGVEGERPLGVRSLSVPTRAQEHDLAALKGSEAVRLFSDRGRVAEPRFEVTDRNAALVAEICRSLDGIPLAIELAAARVKMLSLEQIRSKLDDRFRLLAGGSKTALARHQTLRATIQWSYDHLDEVEQETFRHMAVFLGGWSLEAAVAVTGPEADEFEVLDLLTRLVDKSLVTVDRTEEDEPRYGMLETIRQYAQEKLNERGDADVYRDRHLDWFVALAERAEPLLMGPDQVSWLDRLDRELDNILAAFSWAERATGGAERALRLLASMRNYLVNRAGADLGIRLGREVLARADDSMPARMRGRAIAVVASLLSTKGQQSEARQMLEGALELLTDPAAAVDRLRASIHLSVTLMREGASTEAKEVLRRAIPLARECGAKTHLASAVNNLAELLRAEGDLDAAMAYYEESVELSRELGEVEGLAVSIMNRGTMAILRGTPGAALPDYDEAVRIAERLGSQWIGLMCADNLTTLMVELGSDRVAARLHGAVSALADKWGLIRDASDEPVIRSRMAKARAQLGDAAFDVACASGAGMPLDRILAEARDWIDAEKAK